MAADPLQTFAPGDSIGSLKATTANAWTEAARQARKSARTGAGVSGYRQRPGALEITVQNDTGADLDVRDVVQVSYPLLSPTVYVGDLQREPALLGIVPTSANGTPAVLIEPIPDGTTGRAVIMGVAHVVVDITDAAHTSAVIKVGETGYMNSAAAGAGTATILWRETGTGQKLCCVLLCCADGDPAIGDNPDWPAPASSWYCDAGVCTEVAYGGTPPVGASGPYSGLPDCLNVCGGAEDPVTVCEGLAGEAAVSRTLKVVVSGGPTFHITYTGSQWYGYTGVGNDCAANFGLTLEPICAGGDWTINCIASWKGPASATVTPTSTSPFLLVVSAAVESGLCGGTVTFTVEEV